jgi:multidrug transporter EmrE-like cation transporter
MTANAALLTAYILVSAFGLFELKSADGTFGVKFLIGLGAYGAGFFIWYLMLTAMPLSVAFPLAAGSLIVATQVVGYLMFSEPMAWAHIAGIALILVGITVLFARP